jgi:hypothetical protein
VFELTVHEALGSIVQFAAGYVAAAARPSLPGTVGAGYEGGWLDKLSVGYDEGYARVPIRQWVCSLPWRLRYAMGYDRELCADVLPGVGDLGDNELPSSYGNVDLGISVTTLSEGFMNLHTCALGSSLRCWGRGWNGVLGYGNVNDIDDNETPASAGPVPYF